MKYIDMAEKITEGSNLSNTVSFRKGVAWALEYLDAHPDQVPGRTITESEYSAAVDAAKRVKGVSLDRLWWQGRAFLFHAGVKIVADPEPTNAEKLDKIMEEWPGRATASDPTFGEYLHNRGVKAPGGDDDH